MQNPTPPAGWQLCTQRDCVLHPRWSPGSSASHWHAPAGGQCLTAHIAYEPLHEAVQGRLRDLIEARATSSDLDDEFRSRGRLEGYLTALHDMGLISSNHPLRILNR